ncbi:MAG: aldolase [Rhodospirillaceae bacterium]|nr:aldolase [Rhodospirillaceae bacterium]
MVSTENGHFCEQNRKRAKEHADSELKAHLASNDWPISLKIALACRKLALESHAETLAGQITVRADQNSFWTTSIAGGFGNARENTIVKINNECEVVEGTGIPNPGVRFHLWIYQGRKDVHAIVHTHPPHASALSMTGKPLKVAHMDAAMFFEDCAHLREWPGVPLANEEGKIISNALGSKRSILLANHGLLTTGATIEEATYLAIQFERAARLQILAESIGEIMPINRVLGREAHDFLLQESIIFGSFNAWSEEIMRTQPDVKT